MKFIDCEFSAGASINVTRALEKSKLVDDGVVKSKRGCRVKLAELRAGIAKHHSCQGGMARQTLTPGTGRWWKGGKLSGMAM